ncbi:MAG: hypothetical protein IKF17_00785 [Clostridia bacterium]|nr:hypothetical protein [Clostridia bacterium]
MEQNLSKKLFHICMIIVIIAVILFGVGILIIRYQVEGETNLPFNISKISIISSVDGKDNKDDVNKWNITVNQNNDIYIYIDKNNSYNKTEIIDSIIVDNITFNKETEKGQINIYKPTEKGTNIFENSEDSITNQIIYTGDMESNIKKLKISNQGGLVVFRIANDKVATFISNDWEQVDYSKLLQSTKTTYEDLKAIVNMDLTIKLKSGKSYRTNLHIDVPINEIVEKGTSSKEITDTKEFIFKRIENN